MTGPAALRTALTLEQCWHPVPGGTATSSLALAAALKETGQVDVVGVSALHRRPAAAHCTPAVPVRSLPLPRLALYEAWQRLRRPAVQRATGAVDVVHATTMAVPPPSAPLVVTVHDLAFRADPAHFTRRGVRFFERGLALVHRDAALVLVPSEAVRAECLAAGLPAQRLRVVPHGVAARRAAQRDVARVRARYGINGRYVLWTGTQEPRKNLTTLLEAFSRVDTAAELVLVGPAGWGPRLGDRISRTPRVRSIGFVSNADRDALYAGADVFAFPSLREGFGLPVLEAMAQGTPAVTSAGTAMAEFAVGRLVEPTDPTALAAALQELLDHAALRERLSAQALQAASRLTWERAALGTLAAYREAVAAS